jgi:CBS domain-containing protein
MTTAHLCKDVMTAHPVCCTPDDSILDAAKLMKEHDIGPLVVINDHASQRLVGMLTDRDLATQVVAVGGDPKKMHVREVMTRGPICCREDEAVQSAIDRMAAHQLRRVPIVDHDGRVVGIIAQADVATRLHDRQETARLVETVSQHTH